MLAKPAAQVMGRARFPNEISSLPGTKPKMRGFATGFS
jgi:hypothetical protein